MLVVGRSDKRLADEMAYGRWKMAQRCSV